MAAPSFTVYILASLNRRLYIGVTNDLERRIFQHRAGRAGAFTARYRITRLVILRADRRRPGRDRAGEGTQALEPGKEGCADRVGQRGVAGPRPQHLSSRAQRRICGGRTGNYGV